MKEKSMKSSGQPAWRTRFAQCITYLIVQLPVAITLICGCSQSTDAGLMVDNSFLYPESSNWTSLPLAGSGNDIFVGAPWLASGQSHSGFVYQYDRFDGSLTRGITAPTASSFQEFGTKISAVGDRVLISAPGRHGGHGPGEVFLHDTRTGGIIRAFKNPTPASRDAFGNSIALSGNNAVIGARWDDTLGDDNGAVYVFDTESGELVRTIYSPTAATPQKEFGSQVAIVGDKIAVTERYAESGPETISVGKVHFFDASTGSHVHTIENPSEVATDAFGQSLASIGDDLLVGAPNTDLSVPGAVHRYDVDSGELIRTYTSPTDPSLGGRFGTAIAATDDGKIIVGAPGYEGAGQGYLIDADSGTVLETIHSPNPNKFLGFGQNVAAIGKDVLISQSYSAYHYSVLPTSPEAPPAPTGRLDPQLNLPDGKKNLVLITNGWIAPLFGDPTATQDWLEKMQNAFEANIDSSEWDVLVYDWTNEAQGKLPPLNRAFELGHAEGANIALKEYDHVHLIGHSTGAALIEAASAQILQKSPSTTIHTTFLDPFTPFCAYAELYGASSEWSDNYINSGDLLFTESRLRNAYNVDVTPLNDGSVSGHSWPHKYYTESIINAQYDSLGFALSAEAVSGSWPLAGLDVGNGFSCDPTAERLDDIINFSLSPNTATDIVLTQIYTSNTGRVLLDGVKAFLSTGSPVWLQLLLDFKVPVNFVSFEYLFGGEFGAEGLLSVFINDRPLAQIDQRYSYDKFSQHLLMFPSTFEGLHTLSFRLDPYSDAISSIELQNIRTGYSEFPSLEHSSVPEPSSLALLCISSISLVPILRRKRSQIC